MNCMAIECSTYGCAALVIKCNKGQADGNVDAVTMKSFSLSVGHHNCTECDKSKELSYEL